MRARATLRRYSSRHSASDASGGRHDRRRRIHAAGRLHALRTSLWYGLSIVPFVLWLGRYAFLIGAGAGQAPEELILRDRMLLALTRRMVLPVPRRRICRSLS